MPSDAQNGPSATLGLLESLAARAPASRVERSVRHALGSTGSIEELRELSRVGGPARTVSGELARVRDRETGLIALLAAAHALAGAADSAEAARLAVRHARILLNAEFAFAVLPPAAGGTCRVAAAEGHRAPGTPGRVVGPVRWPATRPEAATGGTKGGPAANGAAPRVSPQPAASLWTWDYITEGERGEGGTHEAELLGGVHPVLRDESIRGLICTRLVYEGAVLGTLFAGDRTVRYFDSAEISRFGALAELAAAALAHAGFAERAARSAPGAGRAELFDLLLTGAGPAPRELEDRARRLSVDLARPFVVVAARSAGAASGDESPPGEASRSWASAFTTRRGGLSTTNDRTTVLLVPGQVAGDAAERVAAGLAAASGVPATAGAAGPAVGADAVPGLCRQAARCLDALIRLGATGTGGSARELGFVGLLLSPDQDVDGFVSAQLGPVQAHDLAYGTELTETLQAYFAAGRSPGRTAQSLYLHPNTVARRLSRIARLLGADWLEPERAVEIQLALRLHRIRDLLITPAGGAGD